MAGRSAAALVEVPDQLEEHDHLPAGFGFFDGVLEVLLPLYALVVPGPRLGGSLGASVVGGGGSDNQKGQGQAQYARLIHPTSPSETRRDCASTTVSSPASLKTSVP